VTLPLPEHEVDPGYLFVRPRQPRPIVIIGAGGIVRDAHLPAYARYGLPVHAIVNRTLERAQSLATQYGVARASADLARIIDESPPNTVYDIALMPEQYEQTLAMLPPGAGVLIQKPLGHDGAKARRIQELCRQRGLVAAVNTQLRFAPYIEQARRAIAAGEVGDLVDVEIRVTVRQPWELFPHVFDLPRLEVNMHSVHYLDLVRSILGEPSDVMCVTLPHPQRPYANCRSTILLRYGNRPLRVVIATNHEHDFGPTYEESFIKFEGTRGAIRIQMGLLLDYPRGGPDTLEIVTHDRRAEGWRAIPFEGSWFPDAFAGSMGVLQRALDGEIPRLPTSVDDVVKTMDLVDAAHESSDRGGVVPRR
jgi:predicted dehydrogenase